MRALRVDKMTYAALEATLQEYAAGRAATTIPVVRMLALDVDEIRRRAQALADGLRGNLTGGTGRRLLHHRRRQRAGLGAADRARSPCATRRCPRATWKRGFARSRIRRSIARIQDDRVGCSTCARVTLAGCRTSPPDCSELAASTRLGCDAQCDGVDSRPRITPPIDRASGATCCSAKPAANAKTTSTSAGIHVLLITVVSQ